MNRAAWNAYWRRAIWAIPIAAVAGAFVAEVQGPGRWAAPYLMSVAGILCAISVRSRGASRLMPADEAAATDDLSRGRRQFAVGGALSLSVAAIFSASILLFSSGMPGRILLDLNYPDLPVWFSAIVLGHLAVFLALEGFVWGMFWSRANRSALAIVLAAILSVTFVCTLANFGDRSSADVIARNTFARSLLACLVLFGSSWRTVSEEVAATIQRVLAWKEFREQRLAWITMAICNAGIVIALHYFVSAAGPQGYYYQAVFLTTLILPAGYGLICSGMMLAGESEGRTLRYLDAVTRTRTEVWKRKCALGAAFTATQGLLSAVIACSAVSVALQSNKRPDLTEAIAMAAAFALPALLAFSIGMFTSAFCRTVLGAAAAGAGFCGAVVAILASQPQLLGSIRESIVFPCAGLACLMLYISWRRFCRLDTQRMQNGQARHAAALPGRKSVTVQLLRAIELVVETGVMVVAIALIVLGIVWQFLHGREIAVAVAGSTWIMVLLAIVRRRGVLRSSRFGPVSPATNFLSLTVAAAFSVAYILLLLALGSLYANQHWWYQVPNAEIFPAVPFLFACWWLVRQSEPNASSGLRWTEQSTAA